MYSQNQLLELSRTSKLILTADWCIFKCDDVTVTCIVSDWGTCRFYFFKATVAGAYDAKKYSVADILRVAFLNNDAMLMDEENQIHGFVTILDFT